MGKVEDRADVAARLMLAALGTTVVDRDNYRSLYAKVYADAPSGGKLRKALTRLSDVVGHGLVVDCAIEVFHQKLCNAVLKVSQEAPVGSYDEGLDDYGGEDDVPHQQVQEARIDELPIAPEHKHIFKQLMPHGMHKGLTVYQVGRVSYSYLGWMLEHGVDRSWGLKGIAVVRQLYSSLFPEKTVAVRIRPGGHDVDGPYYDFNDVMTWGRHDGMDY